VAPRRRLRMRPMARLRPHTRNPMNAASASLAGEQDVAELPLQFTLRLQQFHPQAFRGCGQA